MLLSQKYAPINVSGGEGEGGGPEEGWPATVHAAAAAAAVGRDFSNVSFAGGRGVWWKCSCSRCSGCLSVCLSAGKKCLTSCYVAAPGG